MGCFCSTARTKEFDSPFPPPAPVKQTSFEDASYVEQCSVAANENAEPPVMSSAPVKQSTLDDVKEDLEPPVTPSAPVKQPTLDDVNYSVPALPGAIEVAPLKIPLSGWKRLTCASAQSGTLLQLYVSPCFEYASYTCYPMTYDGKVFTEGTKPTKILQKRSSSCNYTAVLTDCGDVLLSDGSDHLLVQKQNLESVSSWKSGNYKNFVWSRVQNVVLMYNLVSEQTAQVGYISLRCQHLDSPVKLFSIEDLQVAKFGGLIISCTVPFYLTTWILPVEKYLSEIGHTVSEDMAVNVRKTVLVNIKLNICGQNNGDWVFIPQLSRPKCLNLPGMWLKRVHWDPFTQYCYGLFKSDESNDAYLHPVHVLSKRLFNISWLENVPIVPLVEEPHMNVTTSMSVGNNWYQEIVEQIADGLSVYVPVFYHPAVVGSYDNNCSTLSVSNVHAVKVVDIDDGRRRALPLLCTQYMGRDLNFYSGGKCSLFTSKVPVYHPITARRVENGWLVSVPALEVCMVVKPGFVSNVVPQFVVHQLNCPAARKPVNHPWFNVFLEELSLMF